MSPDNTRRLGKTWLTYRGKIDADHFVIDVTIPALDPQTRYSHKVRIKDAREGFSLAGQAYRLVGIQRPVSSWKTVKIPGSEGVADESFKQFWFRTADPH